MPDLGKNYIVSRGYDESGRLYMQHWMWKMQLGYDLHPSIKLPQDSDIRIADQGCGNGVWLVSLASELEKEKKSITLCGFDVKNDHFPAPENLPNNVQLATLDAFTEDLPQEHVGQYDVVHIRAFSSVVKDNNPGPIFKNVYAMLKPGGYIQWDEFDGDAMKAVAPGDDQKNPSVPTTATADLLATSYKSQTTVMNLKYNWIKNFEQLFREHGFEPVENKEMEVKKELRDVMSNSLLMIHDHIARFAVQNGKLIGTDKDWDKLWGNCLGEINQGVSITLDMVVAVGRKPL